jgi:hypothetical protein
MQNKKETQPFDKLAMPARRALTNADINNLRNSLNGKKQNS